MAKEDRKYSYWDALKEAFAQKPDKVDGQFTARTNFYFNELLNIIKGRFVITCPDWWDKDYMLTLLILNGKFFVTDSTSGVAPFDGCTSGLNIFLRPKYVQIVNPVIGTMDRIIDKNCVVIYLYDNKWFRNMTEFINIYAQKLASCDSAIDVNLLNSKVPFIFNCEDAKQAETAKLIYDKISLGEPAVFTRVKTNLDMGNGMEITTLPVKENYIADLIQAEKRAIKAEFLTKIGIDNVDYEKKERLITTEADSNREEIEANITYIKENLKLCSKKVREMFKINFEIGMKEYEAPKEEPKLNREDIDNIDN